MDPRIAALAAEVEAEHWWYRGRRRVLRSVLDRYAPVNPPARTVIEIGCGSGGNLGLLSRYGELFAIEPDDEARQHAARRGIGLVMKGWLPDGLPFEGRRFDLIAALDVLEHVADDSKAVTAMRGRLTPDGLLVVTAPAYGWLWSRHDVLSHHRRRYTRKRLAAILSAAGLHVVYTTYFNMLLFPASIVYVTLAAFIRTAPEKVMRLPPRPVNRALETFFGLESLLIPPVSFPYGVSILACARANA